MNSKFDIIMANLKPLEPSPAFEFEFRRALAEAAARRREETVFEKFMKRVALGADIVRDALVPQIAVIARNAAIFLFLMTAGLYVYSIQPASPIAVGMEGVCMVQHAGETSLNELSLSRDLREGDTVITKDGSRLDIELTNKYILRVKENSTFKVAKLTPNYGKGVASFQLSDGKILVDIEKGFKGSKFIINTDTGSAKALGTKFSVDSSKGNRSKMDVDVLEGRVEVKSAYQPRTLALAKQMVIVGPGQKTEVLSGEVPLSPQRLVEGEWRQLEELYQMGRKPRVILLLKNTPDRAIQLLAPCPIYISDEKPREIPQDVEYAVTKINDAINTGDKAKHLEGIKILENMVAKYPKARYNPQLLLYIGSYYEYLSYHKEAIKVFTEVINKYPESQFASLAECAIGIIYSEKLNDKAKSDRAFRLVLNKYPDSLEAIWIEGRLEIKKLE